MSGVEISGLDFLIIVNLRIFFILIFIMTNIAGSSAQLPKLPISYDKVEVRESGSNKLIGG
jgi:hypothetical protein